MTERLRAALPAAITILVALGQSGCSTTAENSGLSLVDASGNHPSGFVSTHPTLVQSAPDAEQCRPCHGDGLTGGIAGTSCLSSACHHNPVPGWSFPEVHGAEAKKPRTSSGFASCQVCHGVGFDVVINGFSCPDCHGVQAPHPRRPWLNGDPANTSHSDNMALANAPVCDGCHHRGANSTVTPSTPAPEGTPPGCFNSTLCHDAVAPHPLGAVWNFPEIGGSSFHGASAKADVTECQVCHGTPGTILFEGGVALTACSFCHDAAKAHPTDWQGVRAIGGATITHRTATAPVNPSGQCAVCHKVDGQGAGPAPGAPSCFSASFTNGDGQGRSCHLGGPGTASHDKPFDNTTHYQATGASGCTDCHAIDAGTSPLAGAPLCTVCHAAGSPLTLANCSSCHGSAAPPDALRKGMPAGAQYPNFEGAHAEHLALNVPGGTPISCDTCHTGLGTTTRNHYDRANGRTGAGGRVQPGDLAFVGTYNARTGSSSFDNVSSSPTFLRCFNVSCHGGNAPNWQTGAIVVDAECPSCHQLGDSAAGGSPQYNVYFSGRHKKHVVDKAVACTVCHSTAVLAGVHFDDLSTAAMAQARTTMKVTDLNFDGSVSPPTCDPNGTGGIGGCHGQKNWTQENLP